MSESQKAGVHGRAFISYVHEDSDRVDRLQSALEAAGIPVWRDRSDLLPGTDWRMEITEAIANGSLAFLACFSDNSNNRDATYQNEELILATEQMRLRKPGVVWLLPVRFTDCEIPAFDLGAGRTMRSLQETDLFDGRWDQGVGRLIAAIQRIIGNR